MVHESFKGSNDLVVLQWQYRCCTAFVLPSSARAILWAVHPFQPWGADLSRVLFYSCPGNVHILYRVSNDLLDNIPLLGYIA